MLSKKPMWVVNFGHNESRLTENKTASGSLQEQVVHYEDAVAHGWPCVVLLKLTFDSAGLCDSEKLVRSVGLNVSGMVKINCPVPKLKVCPTLGCYAWEAEHKTIGVGVLGNSADEAKTTFFEELSRECGGNSQWLNKQVFRYGKEYFYAN